MMWTHQVMFFYFSPHPCYTGSAAATARRTHPRCRTGDDYFKRRIRTYFPSFRKSSLFTSFQLVLVPLAFKLSTCYLLSKLLAVYFVASMPPVICITSILAICIHHSCLSRACVSPYAQFGGPDGCFCICRHDNETKL
ncbi:hypothetical protein C8Q76DRAFT_344600 [Earliella scabrosa]|nr:hypothetical protein C8Q76DRAFT_344600 [Earliella scabrosa]